jgi:hypothetical protein
LLLKKQKMNFMLNYIYQISADQKLLSSGLPLGAIPALITTATHKIASDIVKKNFDQSQMNLKGRAVLISIDLCVYTASAAAFHVLNLAIQTQVIILSAGSTLLGIYNLAIFLFIPKKAPSTPLLALMPPQEFPLQNISLVAEPPELDDEFLDIERDGDDDISEKNVIDEINRLFRKTSPLDVRYVPEKKAKPQPQLEAPRDETIPRNFRESHVFTRISLVTPLPKNIHVSTQLVPRSTKFRSNAPIAQTSSNYLITDFFESKSQESANLDQLKAFCKENAEHLLNKIDDLVNEGRSFAQRLNRGEIKACFKQGTNEIDEELVEKLLGSFYWHLMALASQKNQTFVEGSFSLYDPDQRIFKFLRSLMPKAYNRMCSHLYTMREDIIGIDLENSNLLPTGMGHVLFLSIKNRGESWVLLKPEPHGFTPTRPIQAMGHILHYLLSVGKKCIPSLFGSDHGVGLHKERTPAELIAYYISLAKGTEGFDKALGEIGDHKGNGRGIQAMFDHLMSLNSQDEKIQAFLQMLTTKYDHIQFRIGDEVILIDW